jgi:twinfilin-like protein
LTPSAFAAHLDHLDAPPPMSETEKALAQIKISEAEEASARVARLFGGDAKSQDHSSPGIGLWSNALKPTGNAMTAVSGLAGPAKGTLKWGSGVEQALAQLKSGHSDGMAVFLVSPSCSVCFILPSSHGSGTDLIYLS